MCCIPQVDADYVARMGDVLDLYAEAPDRLRPVVCFDESPIQLIGEVRRPIASVPGQIERYGCAYRRNGTANLFVFTIFGNRRRPLLPSGGGVRLAQYIHRFAPLSQAVLDACRTLSSALWLPVKASLPEWPAIAH
jgi:hypothetical protein